MHEQVSFIAYNYFTTARTVCDVNSCSHICAVIEGQDECFCPIGFELSAGSTTTCEGTKMYNIIKLNLVSIFSIYFKDINECQNFSPCDQICINTEGSFQCRCNDGFQLQNATQTCQGK